MELVTGMIAIAGLKYAGPAAGDVVKNFLNRVLSPTADALGDGLAHPIAEWHKKRVQNAEELVRDAAQAVLDQGRTVRAVPGRVLWPILERGSLEDDSDLRQRWANLLATAASSEKPEVPPAFVAILSEMSPTDAKVLDWLCAGQLDRIASPTYREFNIFDSNKSLKLDHSEAEGSVANLVRLGLAQHRLTLAESDRLDLFERGEDPDFAETFSLEPTYWRTRASQLGINFYRACHYEAPGTTEGSR